MTASLSRTDLVCVCTNISTRCVLTFALKLVLSQTNESSEERGSVLITVITAPPVSPSRMHRLTVSVFFSMESLPQLVSSLKARNSCPDYEMVIMIVYNNHK